MYQREPKFDERTQKAAVGVWPGFVKRPLSAVQNQTNLDKHPLQPRAQPVPPAIGPRPAPSVK